LNGNFKGDMGEVLGYPQCEERGRLGVQGKSRSKPLSGSGKNPSGSGKNPSGSGKYRVRRVGRGGQGGSTELDGNFKGDMGEVSGYPRCEERGRLGVQGKSRSKPPSGSGKNPSGSGKIPSGSGKYPLRTGSRGAGGGVGVGPRNRTGPSRGIRGRCRGIPGVKKGGGYVLTQDQGWVSPRGAPGQEKPLRVRKVPPPDRVGRVGRGGRGGSTESDGNFEGDTGEVSGYPRCEERGRLRFDPRPGVGQSPRGSVPLRVMKNPLRVGKPMGRRG
jgi:hypothetical protein